MRFPNLLSVVLLLCVSPLSASPSYQASGVCVHQCSCAYACPCMFENGPDNCALAAVYHLDHAVYDGTDISGLSMISIDGAVGAHGGSACCTSPGMKGMAMKSTAAKTEPGVVYLDARATPAQRAALLGILEAHGEWPGPGRPVKSVPISFTKTAHGYKTLVPGLFDGEAAQVMSRNGSPITVDGVGFAEGPHWTVGRSVVNDLHDASLGLHWHMPNTNGSWSQFHWSS